MRARIIIPFTLRKKCPYSESFWSVFSRTRTECGETLRISPYSVQMRENTGQNNSEYRHFLGSVRNHRQVSPINIREFDRISTFLSTWNQTINNLQTVYTAQKIKFSIKDFFSKCDQIRRKLRIWSRLLKKS